MTEQRYQAVLAVISDGLSISQVASKVGVSRQTLHSCHVLQSFRLQDLHRPFDTPRTSNGEVRNKRALRASTAP